MHSIDDEKTVKKISILTMKQAHVEWTVDEHEISSRFALQSYCNASNSHPKNKTSRISVNSK